jgi:tRNA-(ms[2]io[6]A)-hydroxylase
MTRRSVQLHLDTPPQWVEVILENFDEFLCDHANCERKASALAVSLAVKHPDRTAMIPTLLALAQEELEHYAQVYALMAARGLRLVKDSPDPYVNALLGTLRSGRDARFLDRMLVSSVIECRGAERFRLIAGALEDPQLGAFYDRFWKAEAKHGHQFVDMVLPYFDEAEIYARLEQLMAVEAEIVAALPWRASLH